MIVFSHPTGNANARQAAIALAEAGMLTEFWTCIDWNPDSIANRLMPSGWREQLGRRVLPAILRERSRTRPFHELARHLCARIGWEALVRHERGLFCVDAVYKDLDRHVADEVKKRANLTGVYCYEDGAAATFSAARRRGACCIYDLPIGYWRAAQEIYADESEREPEWSSTLSGSFDSLEKLARKDVELEMADVVVVASNFTRQTLGYSKLPAKPVVVIPYGSPNLRRESVSQANGGALRVLFVGSLGQRKGLTYLLEAVRMLGPSVELTMLGRKVVETCRPLNGATKRHRWIPSLPHAEVLEEMNRHDVMVFPSLFEGFGLVILEAMSQGLPVITTPHTGGPDVIDNGQNGFLVPIRSAEAIAARLEELVENVDRLRAMKHAALRKAELFAWQSYRNKLVTAISAVVYPKEVAQAEAK